MIRQAINTLKIVGDKVAGWFRPRPHLRLVATDASPAVQEQISEPVVSTPPPKREPSPRRQALRNMSRQRILLSTSIDDVLSRLERVNLHSFRGDHRLDAGKNQLVSSLIGHDYHHIDEIVDDIRLTLGQSTMGFFDPEADVRELVESVWPIDIGLCTRKKDKVVLSRTTSVHPKILRGKAHMTSKYCACVSYLNLHDDGQVDGEMTYAALLGNKFVPIDNGPKECRRSVTGMVLETIKITGAKYVDEMTYTVGVGLSVALSMRYEWHVALGNSVNGTRLLIPTSPSGCLSFFRNREKDSALSRRAALRHWVHNHYRNKDEFEMSYVRDHLRGATEFQWHKLEANILVSQFDMERNEFFKEQADQWRRNRKHNSVRVRLKKARAS